METKRVFLQIDGSNFYHRLKEFQLTGLLNFDYRKLLKTILLENEKAIANKYYIAAIREESDNLKSKILMANQIALFNNLRKQGWEIGFGHMLKTDTYHEKGVDALIAVDMLIGAYENNYDKIILISSDTDLLPAIKKVKTLGKIIEYVGFSHKPSQAMIANCSSSYLLRKKDLQECLMKK